MNKKKGVQAILKELCTQRKKAERREKDSDGTGEKNFENAYPDNFIVILYTEHLKIENILNRRREVSKILLYQNRIKDNQKIKR